MLNVLEVCEHLAYYNSIDYNSVKFLNAVYDKSTNILTSRFLFDINNLTVERLEELKPALEAEYKKAVEVGVIHVFEYSKSYIDELLLHMLTRQMLKNEFSMIMLDLTDDDIVVSRTLNGFCVNLWLRRSVHSFIENSLHYKRFIKRLHDENFCAFSFYLNEKAETESCTDTLEKLDNYIKDNISDSEVRPNKTAKISGLEYYLGKSIKQKPIRLEFLKVSSQEQVIAGRITNLTKREYKKKSAEGEEVAKPYYTFLIADDTNKVSCVFFPRKDNATKFEKLGDGICVCVIGVNSEKNGRLSFMVLGISLCELG